MVTDLLEELIAEAPASYEEYLNQFSNRKAYFVSKTALGYAFLANGNTYSKRQGRVANDNANASLPLPQLPESEDFFDDRGSIALRDVQDLRQFHPDRVQRHPRLTQGTGARIQTRSEIPGPNEWINPDAFTFQTPLSVVICVRRKQRKETLFARGKIGDYIRTKLGKRNVWSNFECVKYGQDGGYRKFTMRLRNR
jgi:hypothetical protein